VHIGHALDRGGLGGKTTEDLKVRPPNQDAPIVASAEMVPKRVRERVRHVCRQLQSREIDERMSHLLRLIDAKR
jgi:hypothetical protein